MIDQRLLIKAVIMGVVWGVMFYFVRKGLNKRNFAENPEKKREAFYWDAMYGALAAGLSVIVKEFINKTV